MSRRTSNLAPNLKLQGSAAVCPTTIHLTTHNLWGIPLGNCNWFNAPGIAADDYAALLARDVESTGSTVYVYAAQEAFVYPGFGPICNIPYVGAAVAVASFIPCWFGGFPPCVADAFSSLLGHTASNFGFFRALASGLHTWVGSTEDDLLTEYVDHSYPGGLAEDFMAAKGFTIASRPGLVVCNTHTQVDRRRFLFLHIELYVVSDAHISRAPSYRLTPGLSAGWGAGKSRAEIPRSSACSALAVH